MAIDSTVQRIVRLTPLSAILALIEEQVAAVAARPTALAEAVGAALCFGRLRGRAAGARHRLVPLF